MFSRAKSQRSSVTYAEFRNIVLSSNTANNAGGAFVVTPKSVIIAGENAQVRILTIFRLTFCLGRLPA